MDQLMLNIITFTNPLSNVELDPDVIVNYDVDNDRFYVTFVETGTWYPVDRGARVSENFKYTDAINNEILSGCETDDNLDVFFTPNADNEVHMIWMANCDIF